MSAVTAAPALAQDTGEFRVFSDQSLPPSIVTDDPIDEVIVSGAPAGREEQARVAFGGRVGSTVSWLQLQDGLAAVRKLEGVGSADFVVERRSNPTRVILHLNIVASAPKPEEAQFPTLHRDERSLLTFIINGAAGTYTDKHPWFGDPATFTMFSPVATDPPNGRRASWVETSVEVGAGGITQLGSSPLYVYGAATQMFTASAGQDLFNGEPRSMLRAEKLYAGVIVGQKGVTRTANISAGRQNFNLGDGFLISQYSGSSNAGPRPGLYLNPRTAFDFAGVANLRFDRARLRLFYLNPDELEDFESGTKLAGANLTYAFGPGSRVGATYVGVVQSNSRNRLPTGGSLPREGLNTISFEGAYVRPFGLSGVWLLSEYARQWRGDAIRSWAGYVTAGWRSEKGWKPSFSYRFSAFSGDNPNTRVFTRYDPLLSGGLAEWVQGLNFKKIIGNSNVNVQRLRGTANPNAQLTFTLDFFHFRARELNNVGGNPALSQLSSHQLGDELTLRTDWSVSKKLFLLIVASHAIPGAAIRDATKLAARPWNTLQLSAFWSF